MAVRSPVWIPGRAFKMSAEAARVNLKEHAAEAGRPQQNPAPQLNKGFKWSTSWAVLLLWQVRVQARTESSRSYDSHSSSTISSDAAGANKPAPPPVALKPSVTRVNPPSEEQSPGKEEDPANKSFLGKVSIIIISLFIAFLGRQIPVLSY